MLLRTLSLSFYEWLGISHPFPLEFMPLKPANTLK